ncbi:ryanodine receptor isoform X4 [Macrobrachium rosenbergii]|uniref:ryanodine receptor isoform X4 n=1 Tax=Macrobrachium rosenbergii TaxID=79674 RepID=UPI0034D551AB
MADGEGSSEQDDVSFLRTEDMVILSCTATGERVCLAAEGFGNRTCFLENIADKNNPPNLSQGVFVIEQALSVRALQELVTAAASEEGSAAVGKGTGSGHRTLLYGNAVLLYHQNSMMYLACLSTSSSKDKLAFDVGLQEHSKGESCWWTIHPASKQRSEGEKVRVGDDLILVSVATERYLQATREDEQSIVNASFHVTHWSVLPFGTGLSRLKFVACVFGGEVLRFFHGGDECLSIPSTWSDQPGQNIVVYEGGSVTSQARSLWRLELARTKWSGGYINWFHPMRIRHITTGRYLGINEQNELVLLPRDEATVAATAFYLREEKDDNKVILEDKDLEVIGTPLIKYGDSTVIVQHIETGLWLSYRAFEIKKKGVGKVEVKQATLHEEGKMDDGLVFYRSQEEESRTARVIRKCSHLFNIFIKGLDCIQQSRRHSILLRTVNLKEMISCLEDLINYFAYPEDDLEHEERQVCLRALRNRQDLFQEEGILNLILDAIDKITVITSQGYMVALAGEEAGQDWEIISGYLYQLLAAVIKGNHTNCSQFANSHRLNWLFSRLGSAGEGTGMLDVLHCVLIDSPEALNVMKEEHIKVIIALLEKYGRDPKVLDVLRSLCIGNGTAVRSSQNNICDYLLPGRNLLLQTQLVDHVSSARPNIFVGHVEGSAMYQRFYYEVTLDHIEQVSHLNPHLRLGWANTKGYVSFPGGGEKWGGNGVGDDLYSYGFDGSYLWTGGRYTLVNPQDSEPPIKKGDVVGCALDLTVPIITFYINGRQVNGAFTGFNLDGMFFPVVSASAKLSARFLLGGEHGRLKYPPPEGYSPVSECLLPFQTLTIDPCFYFGEQHKATLAGPLLIQDDVAFVPKPVDTSSIQLPGYIEQVRDKLAENIHEMWAMNKIEQGWTYSERRDDLRLHHPCLTSFEKLPPNEKRYDATLALQTLKTVLALGYHITLDKPPSRIRSVRLPNDPFLQSNGYKPAPLDLSQVSLTPKLEELVYQLAENTHNIWARERIQQGWTYGLNEDPDMHRSPHLVSYANVDEAIKKANMDTASETIRTLLVYGYILEAPTGDQAEAAAAAEEAAKKGVANRTYRLEKTNAVTSGKWYFEMEVLTTGPMRVGWMETSSPPNIELGSDDKSWAFDGYHHQKHFSGYCESYGRKVQAGDVIGVMLDLHDKGISFSLNGELMMDASGSETAFSDVQGEAFVPALTLGVGQKAHLVFGHDINQLKFFTTYGLQEGYEPFCVNMERPVTFWYTKDQPIFENNDDLPDSTIDVTRIPAGSETPPCLKIASKMFEQCEKANWEFLRLSLPVVCDQEFIEEDEKAARWEEVKNRQSRIHHGDLQPPSALQSSLVDTGFSLSDIKELHYTNEEGVEADEGLAPKEPGKTTPEPAAQAPEGGGEDIPPEPSERKKRGKSPFRFFSKKRDASSERARSKGRTPEPSGNTLEVPHGAKKTRSPSVRLSNAADGKLIPPAIPERQGAGEEIREEDLFDPECLKLMNEYFYGVRIFPGQDPAHVYIGWVTTQYHIHDTAFDQSKVRSVIVQEYTEEGLVQSAVERHSCYMFRADELHAEVTSEAGGKGASQGMFIGCFIDTSTGFITLQCDGKDTRHKYRMEPGTKLFPGVFLEPTSKEVLQIELGRTPTTLPLSAAVLQNSDKHVVPQMPPRLRVQILKANQWSRVPNINLRIHALKLSDIRGWSMLAEDAVPMLALHIPEEDRCIDILELIEYEKLLSFHAQSLALYCAVCYQSNYRAAHTLCSHVDQKQLLYAMQNEYMSGPLRMGFYNLLISLHLESFANTMEVTQNEFIVPLSPNLKEMYQDETVGNSMSITHTESVRPIMSMSDISQSGAIETASIHSMLASPIPHEIHHHSTNIETIKGLASPYFPLDVAREFVMTALGDAVKTNQVHNRDPIGGSNENLFVPLLKLVDKLLLVGILQDEDILKLLIMIDPQTWDPEFDVEGKDADRKGLLQMKIAEGVKLQLCYVLHHLLDIQKRHRVENIISFAMDYVGEIQQDQLRRYIEIKQSDLPSSVAAKKTREFRCPPREQMNAILGFKNWTDEELEESPCCEELRNKLIEFHDYLMSRAKIPGGGEEEGGSEETTADDSKGVVSKVLSILSGSKEEAPEAPPAEPAELDCPDKFKKVLVETIVWWAAETFIETPVLIREMFSLLLRQYNSVGELMTALEKTYVISSQTSKDVGTLWLCLSKVRALLPVQMSQEEEELMRELLWTLVNNHLFFQHPDLIRILCVHENVMAVMMNTLGRRAQAQSETQVAEGEAAQAKEKDTSHEMVVGCCKFLCYFCRSGHQNQKAMFEHLPFLLENSNILLSRPSLRGTTPLDVAYSSLMDNTELALALREHHLEKIAVYLSRCGLQSNSELVERGYPDLGWDPVEGERYLDFLRFCVWVGGESVEENANLVIRLLIRRPECLGPALRGEGEGLLCAIIDANKMSERIAAQRLGAEAEGAVPIDHPMPAGDDDEDYIDTGAAILNFYCTLVDLMGRCAPEANVIAQGKNDSLRARAILRSLVPLEDLQGVLSLRFTLSNTAADEGRSDIPPGLIPAHKQSVVLFLERVYGMDNKDLFFSLLEDAFLPDLRAATMLDKSDGSESEMGLALNRYIGNSILPALISHSSFYSEAEQHAPLLDATLHTVYRLSKCKILTKGQREAVSDFLIALTREMQPAMLLPLLRKLTIDVSKLSEYTTVALRLLTLHYERCSKYYNTSSNTPGTASEEEKRLTMILFTNIFDSLAKMEYDPELFSKALPCLSAIGCSLPPDYSLTHGYEDELYNTSSCAEGPYNPMPIDTTGVELSTDIATLLDKFSEHYHDAWASRKLENGWSYSDTYTFEEKGHPRLKPYLMLSDYERERYKEPVRDALKALLAINWNIEYESMESSNSSAREQIHRQDTTDIYNYNPQPVDMTNLTLSREMQNMAERLAENAHDIWAKRKKDELEACGGGFPPQMVPYDMLTEKEKRKDRFRSVELLKYLQFMGYRLCRSHGSGDDGGAAAGAVERRFAYSLLGKLLQYLDCAAINMKLLKPSSSLSRRSSFKTSTKDVKFFSKVVLPFMEKYFSTNRNYFLAVALTTNMVGAASLKEKEMVASLFCKLANLMRLKLVCFGSDTKVTVKCLQVIVRAVDAKTLTKNLPEFVRTSMLTFFNNAAVDLEYCIHCLQEGKYAYIRGTHLKTSASLNYVQTVLLPVLTSLFDHTAACEFGQDLLLDEIQVACYKILAALYQLGTDLSLDGGKTFMKKEIDRHRPAIGNALGAFAATFPVAYLEPMMNKNNPWSIHNRIADQSLEAQEIIVKMETAIPSLETLIKEVEKFVDEEGKHSDMPHIIDVILPMLCSYLPFWWNQGPDNVNPSEGNHVTGVTCEHMNQLLRLVLRLIMYHVGVENAPWMTRIAGYTQQIIINSSEELLRDPYLPLAERVYKRTEHMYNKEENLRSFLKSSTEDTSQVEGQLQEEWQLLTRDIYAFYPLLIKYVDQQRNQWLKNSVPEAEDVYNRVASIFHIWSNSQYFRREETNFISQNEIDNMTLIMPTGSTRNRNAAMAETSGGGGGGGGGKVKQAGPPPYMPKKKKRAGGKKISKEKELASSLMVACLKRLLPVGLNLFAGKEQELVQHCKEKFLAKVNEAEIFDFAKTQLTLPDRIDPSDAMNWQHILYSRLGGGRVPREEDEDKKIVPTVDDTVERIVAMAKVLYGLHIACTPPASRSGWRKLLSFARKRAAIACLRSVPFYNIRRHRAVNLFLRTYREFWLSDENVGQEVVIEDLTQSFEEAESKKKEAEEDEGKPDQLTQLVTTFSRKATTEHSGVLADDPLYMSYAEIMAKSCGEEEEEGGDEEGGEEEGGNEDPAAAINEQELEKQKLLFHQARLSNRGVAEMVLLHISASRGQPGDMVMRTLELGISILRGGNVDIQATMLNYLKEKKDASFFLSIAGLMNSCSVLDLDAFERNTKAEGLGVGADGCAGEKNMHDAEFTCALFRFIQLTCEGHNLDWQNYLRTQAGNTTTVNVINCTVDYLLRLQESIMDFYWHYSSKEIIDPAGKTNFFKAIGVASQVFNTLTEVIQGPCVGNQQTLAHSRLWDAVGGFLFLFAHMQDKLSKHSCQVDLLKELLNLQKDMVIMMLSMLEGNVVNGTIGKQMVDTLVESASNVEMIVRFFNLFLRLKEVTSSASFQELDINKDGTVTPKEFKEKMEQQKNYTTEEINFLLMCCDTNHDGKIDYVEFTERFHNPAKDIGFNLAVLLTNLSEHMPNDPRLARFLETAGSVLNYFEPFLGRIEIMGSSKRIERVYFEIKEENIDQWEKPQIKDSKRNFFFDVVTEGDKEKLEAFVNFCEDAIFEMQHAAALMEEEDDAMAKKAAADGLKYLSEEEEEKTGMDLIKSKISGVKDHILEGLSVFAPSNVKKKIKEMKQMSSSELAVGFCKLLFLLMYHSAFGVCYVLHKVWIAIMGLMQGPPTEKGAAKEEEKSGPLVPLAIPALPEPEAEAPPPEEEEPKAEEEAGTGAIPLDMLGDEKVKPILDAVIDLKKEEVTIEEAFAATKVGEKKEVESAQAAAMEEAEAEPSAAAAEPPPVAQESLGASIKTSQPSLPSTSTPVISVSSHHASKVSNPSAALPSNAPMKGHKLSPSKSKDHITSSHPASLPYPSGCPPIPEHSAVASFQSAEDTVRSASIAGQVRKSQTLPSMATDSAKKISHTSSVSHSISYPVPSRHTKGEDSSTSDNDKKLSRASLSSTHSSSSLHTPVVGISTSASAPPSSSVHEMASSKTSSPAPHKPISSSFTSSSYVDLRSDSSGLISSSASHIGSPLSSSPGLTVMPSSSSMILSSTSEVNVTEYPSPSIPHSHSSPVVTKIISPEHLAISSSKSTTPVTSTITIQSSISSQSLQPSSHYAGHSISGHYSLTRSQTDPSSISLLSFSDHSTPSTVLISDHLMTADDPAASDIHPFEAMAAHHLIASQSMESHLTTSELTSSDSFFMGSPTMSHSQSSLLDSHLFTSPSAPQDTSLLNPGLIDASQLTPSPPTPTQPHPPDIPPQPPTPEPQPILNPPTTPEKRILQKVVCFMVDLSGYNKRIVSLLARNFYNLKYAALVLAFCINFILLFFKATAIESDEEEEEETASSPFDFGSGDLLGSGDDAVLGDDAAEDLGSGNFTLEDDGEEEEEDEEETEEWIHMDDRYFYLVHILRIFSVTHSIVATCMLLAYYNLKIPLVIFKREKEVARRLEFDGVYVAEQPEDDDIKAHWDKLVISAKSFPNNYWDKFVKKKVREKYSETYDFDAISNLLGMETTMSFKHEEASTGIVGYLTSVDWRYQLWKAGVTITDNQFLYNLWYLTFSLLGNINYFFFAAHLLDVAVSIPSLKTILQSVTHNGKQLILTCMLLTITVYLYTVIAFNFFRKFYVSEEDEVVDQKCHDMLTCFTFHLYKGVRAGGGIGDEIEAPDGDEYELYRIIFDITFFFFIIVILLAIIQGLIIDAFGELRDQLESVKENLESNCFICGIGSDYFDAVPHGFDMHVLKEHNLANYMFFLMHLINKDETEYTGQETYVWNMYQQRCWDFFPVGDCFRKQYEEELSGGGSSS